MHSFEFECPFNSSLKALPYANIYFGVPILIIGIFGSAINIHNVLIFCYVETYHNAYGYLCVARGICNIVNLLLFIIYVAPYAIFQPLPDKESVGRIFGMIARVGYATIPILQLGTAYNRVVAIFFPLRYNQICTKHWAWIIICCGLTYGVAIGIYDIAEDCHLIFESSEFSWIYINCSELVQNYKLVYPLLAIAVLTLFINLLTAAKLFTEKLGSRKSSRKNTKLFWQSFIQMLFVNDLIVHHYLPDLIHSILWFFFTRTLVWELSHTLDGLVMLAFDPRLRKSLRSHFQRRKSTVVVLK